MIQSIDLSRMLLFFRKYAYENKKMYSFLFLAVAAFFTLWLGIQVLTTNSRLLNEPNQVIYYFLGLFLSGCLSAGILFSELGNKPKAIHYLLLPASTAEKFLCTLFFAVLIFLMGYTVAFYAIDSLAVMLANSKFDTHWAVINVFALGQYENRMFDGSFSLLYFIYFPFQAFFILTSVYFSKNGLFKAIVAVGVLWTICTLVFMTLSQFFPEGDWLNDGLHSFEVNDGSGNYKIVTLPLLLTGTMTIFFKFLLAPLLWVTAYFKLKEKEL